MKPQITIDGWANFLNDGRTVINEKGEEEPFLKPPHPKQLALIHDLFQPDPNRVKLFDLCCGRAFGKSFLTIFIATMALSLSPHEIGLFLEPDWRRVKRVFLKKWFQIVPKRLYTHRVGDNLIIWNPTGAQLFYGPRNITAGSAAMEDAQLGQDATFILSDEESLKCNYNMYVNNLGIIRERSNVRFYLTAATPRPGAYKRLVTGKTHKLYRGSSYDNPYLPPNTIRDMEANMGRAQARRELLGEFEALEGSLWPDANWEKWDPKNPNTDCAWPNGNRHDTFTTFDKDKPWWLGCDLGGANGAYVVVQKTDAVYRGRMLFSGPVWVAVADLCPRRDANAEKAFRTLREHFGVPAGIVGGMDINTESAGNGKTVAFYSRNIFSNVKIYPCSERDEDKQLQYTLLSSLINSYKDGHRRFTIARDFISLEPESYRGVQEMIVEDAWPADDKIREGDVLPKNKEITVQHTRDALLMLTGKIMKPARYSYSYE